MQVITSSGYNMEERWTDGRNYAEDLIDHFVLDIQRLGIYRGEYIIRCVISCVNVFFIFSKFQDGWNGYDGLSVQALPSRLEHKHKVAMAWAKSFSVAV